MTIDGRYSPEEREQLRKVFSLRGGALSGKNRAQRQRITSGFHSMLPKGAAMSSSGGDGLTPGQKRQLRERQHRAKRVVQSRRKASVLARISARFSRFWARFA